MMPRVDQNAIIHCLWSIKHTPSYMFWFGEVGPYIQTCDKLTLKKTFKKYADLSPCSLNRADIVYGVSMVTHLAWNRIDYRG
jgi:hypothetical protein